MEEAPALGTLSFRMKLLFALVGTVSVLGAVSLFVVRLEMQRQIDWIVRRTAERAQQALVELERFRRAELARLAQRLTGSVRIAAALDAALDDNDARLFVERVTYELTLAELERGLVAFTDRAGVSFVTLLDGTLLPSDAGGEDPFVRPLVDGAPGPVSGYRVLNGKIFAVQAHTIELFGEPIGTLTVGFPVDDEVAGRLAEIIDAHVCFAVLRRCSAASAAARSGELHTWLSAAAGSQKPTFVTWEGRRLALVSSALVAGRADMHSVIAVPIDEPLQPFERLQRAEWLAAGGALALALIFGAVLSRGLTRPIQSLMAATERVRHGDFDFQVSIRSRDELGHLAEGFNQMTAGLLLKERYRGVLDKVVSPDVAEELLKGDVTLGGETREVTTLFADIRGFTTMTEGMEPQAVIEMLNEWLELAGTAITAEGGIVDKYVGDQIMAVFGAPIPQNDHALRAVRAALRMQAATTSLSDARCARGEMPIEIGVGINTGRVVAGNTGSAKRLNYTVLGEAVNVASRLCAEAARHELLVSEATYAQVATHVRATALPPRTVKGLSRPIQSFVVHGLCEGIPGRVTVSPTCLPVVLFATVFASIPAPSAAQAWFDLPTLSELGLRYISPDGSIQVQPSLRIDLEGYMPGQEPAWLIPERDPFAAGRVRLFADVLLGERVFGLVEVRADRGQAPAAAPAEIRFQQAFVRVTAVTGSKLHVQAGRFVSPFGNLPQRRNGPADPFIRPPMLYDYRTVISPRMIPPSNDAFLTWKDRDPERFRAQGSPIVWDTPYQLGVMFVGAAVRRFAYRLAVMNSAPSSGPDEWTRLSFGAAQRPSFVAHAAYQLTPELQVGGAYSVGGFLEAAAADLPPGTRPRDFVQEMQAVEATFTRAHLELRGEVVWDRWEVPQVIENPHDLSWYLEGKLTLAPGLFGAVRYSAIYFNDIARQVGGSAAWDHDVDRWQLGAGYRLGRSSEARGEYMWNHSAGPRDPHDNLLSLQWRWMF
jgi:adenylate cyclase